MIGKTNAQRKVLLTTPGTVTPTKSQQIITTPDGYDGMDQITVNAIPNNYIDTSDGDATAAQILSGKKAYVDGSLVTGTMTNRGNVGTKTLNATTTSYTIPKGYHNGSGKVQHSTATQATPTISVSSSGIITASSTQSAGYVSGGTKSATYTLSDDDDKEFKASNIKNGVTIFGTTGNYSPSTSSSSYTFIGGGSTFIQTIYINGITQKPISATVSGYFEQNLGCILMMVVDFNTGIMGYNYYHDYNGTIMGGIVNGAVTWDSNNSRIIINPFTLPTSAYGYFSNWGNSQIIVTYIN